MTEIQRHRPLHAFYEKLADAKVERFFNMRGLTPADCINCWNIMACCGFWQRRGARFFLRNGDDRHVRFSRPWINALAWIRFEQAGPIGFGKSGGLGKSPLFANLLSAVDGVIISPIPAPSRK